MHPLVRVCRVDPVRLEQRGTLAKGGPMGRDCDPEGKPAPWAHFVAPDVLCLVNAVNILKPGKPFL